MSKENRTCKDCLHYQVCADMTEKFIEAFPESPANGCSHFISHDSLVKRGRWKNIHIAIVDTTGNCTVCGQEAVWRTRKKPYANCPNCGVLMED